MAFLGSIERADRRLRNSGLVDFAASILTDIWAFEIVTCEKSSPRQRWIAINRERVWHDEINVALNLHIYVILKNALNLILNNNKV